MWRGWFLRDERRFDQSTYSLTMTKSGKQKARQIGICLLCAALTWRYAAGLEGTEFSGGRITGPFWICSIVVVFFLSRRQW